MSETQDTIEALRTPSIQPDPVDMEGVPRCSSICPSFEMTRSGKFQCQQSLLGTRHGDICEPMVVRMAQVITKREKGN